MGLVMGVLLGWNGMRLGSGCGLGWLRDLSGWVFGVLGRWVGLSWLRVGCGCSNSRGEVWIGMNDISIFQIGFKIQSRTSKFKSIFTPTGQKESRI